MTALEMLVTFEEELATVHRLTTKPFKTYDIDHFLNYAQEVFIKQRYGTTNNKRQAFEETQKRTDDLQELVRETNIALAGVGNKVYGVTYPLPADYWFSLMEEVDVTYPDCNDINVTERVGVSAEQSDDYNELINDPFNKPTSKSPIRLMYNGNIEVIGDINTTFGALILRYIKIPQKISVTLGNNCELADHAHREIVDIAVSHALENLANPRFQSNATELIKHE